MPWACIRHILAPAITSHRARLSQADLCLHLAIITKDAHEADATASLIAAQDARVMPSSVHFLPPRLVYQSRMQESDPRLLLTKETLYH